MIVDVQEVRYLDARSKVFTNISLKAKCADVLLVMQLASYNAFH